MDANNERRHHQMATNDGFPPDDRVPFFLSEHAEQTEQPDIGKVWDRAAISSRILKASILGVTATAIGIAILLMGDPVALVENVTATWVEKPALQPDADPTAPAIQSIASTAGTQDLPSTTSAAPASDAPARDEIAAAVEPADQSQAEIGQPLTEALFKQFQAWADEQDTRAQVEPKQPVQAAPVRVAQDAPAQVRPVKKHRRVRSVQNARAEIRPQRNHRVRTREESAPLPIAPAPDARAPEQPVQNSQTPGLLQSFGFR
jgi:hypothetical protein